MENTLVALSNELANAVERASRAVVTVNARPRVSSSGVHWRPGVIVTAQHTLKRDEEITVSLPDGRTVAATVAGRDPGTDLAVLRVESAALEVAETGSGDPLKAGQLVLAVGRSRETGVNATMGVISAVHGAWRTWQGGLIDQFVRLDVALYPGSSGGAVVNPQGRFLGIATSGLSRFAGLAIPAATVERVATELLAKGHVSRAYLGVGLQPVSLPERLRKALSLAEGAGLIVLSLEQDGPAERAGVLVGDILLAVDEKPLKDTDDLQASLETCSAGKPFKALLLRGGALAELSITAGERPRRAD